MKQLLKLENFKFYLKVILVCDVSLLLSSGEQTCPSGNPLRQVVIGSTGGNTSSSSCGSNFIVDSDSWQAGLTVPVLATVDLVSFFFSLL